MPDANPYSTQRTEIIFYMEKGFQSSFVYLAALLVIGVFASTKAGQKFSMVIGIAIGDAIAITILILNLLYFILLCSCLFAILKRGLFILHGPKASDQDWEAFARRPAVFNAWNGGKSLAWNIDNLFMMPMFLVVLIVAGVAVYVGWSSDFLWVRYSTAALCAAHAVPFRMMFSIASLYRECHRRVETIWSRGGE